MPHSTLLRSLGKVILNGTHTDSGVKHLPDEPICLRWALEYLHLGWCPVALCPPDHSGKLPPRHCKECKRPGKAPPWKWNHLREQLPTDPEVRGWWAKNPGLNLGIVLGRASGLVGIDVDGPEGEEELRRACGGTVPETLRFTTPGGGYRLLFAWERGTPTRTTACPTAKKPLHFLGDGSLTVAPPSGHARGGEYQWVPESFDALAHLPPVPDCLMPYFLPGADQPKRKTKRTTSGGRLASSGADRINRAFAWLIKVDPAVSGQGGSNQMFKVCCRLVHGFGLSREEAMRLLVTEYNPRCQPPWSERELEHKLGDAIERGTSRDMLGDRAERCVSNTALPLPAPGPTDPPPQPARVAPAAASVTRPPTPSTPTDAPAAAPSSPTDTPAAAAPPTLPGRLASTLVDRPTEPFLAPYFARGTLCLTVGVPGSGKTTFQAYLMTLARRVVLVTGAEEDLDRDVLPRLKAFGVNPGDVLIIESGEVCLPRDEDKLVDTITRFEADALFFDCVDDQLEDGKSENSSDDVRPFLLSFKRVAQRTGAMVVGNRHPGKDPTNVNPGSRQWAAVPRAIVEFVRIDGPPERYIIRSYKRQGRGSAIPPRYSELVKLDSGLETIRFGDVVDAETVDLASSGPNRAKRWKIDLAEGLIRHLLKDGKMEAKVVYAAGDKEKLNDDVMDRAAKRMGVSRWRVGFGANQKGWWSLTPPPPGEN